MFNSALVETFAQQPTPFYYYDTALLDKTLKSVAKAADKHNFHVHYAIKANTNPYVLERIQKAGFGADCVSGNEVKCSLEAGFTANKVVFAGVGKSDAEIIFALQNEIYCFNCESIQELEVIQGLAATLGVIASIALRINPNVNAYTHHYITTGLEENKFGINMWEMDRVVALLNSSPNLKLKGIHFHIGSQITNLTPFKDLCNRVNEIQRWFEDKHLSLDVINVGGGLGVDYHQPDENPIPDFESYFQLFADLLEVRPHQEIHFELGRSMVANCCSLISRVLYVKNGLNTNFAILDAGMTELIRPALYQSYHKIENISHLGADANQKYDVVGPICESSDCFGKAVLLPETKRGDLIAIRTAGAYGEVMASNYNLREKAPSVYTPVAVSI